MKKQDIYIIKDMKLSVTFNIQKFRCQTIPISRIIGNFNFHK